MGSPFHRHSTWRQGKGDSCRSLTSERPQDRRRGISLEGKDLLGTPSVLLAACAGETTTIPSMPAAALPGGWWNSEPDLGLTSQGTFCPPRHT